MRALEPLPLAGRKGFVIGIANDQSIAVHYVDGGYHVVG